MMYMETVAVTFENVQKHINVFFLVLKVAVYTPTVRVCNNNYSSLKLCCLK